MHSPVEKLSDGIHVTRLFTVVSVVELVENGEVIGRIKAIGVDEVSRATSFLTAGAPAQDTARVE